MSVKLCTLLTDKQAQKASNFNTGVTMKFLILAIIVLSTSAYAYHTHTVSSDPKSTRDPASLDVKAKK
jgi:hypothetical protein